MGVGIVMYAISFQALPHKGYYYKLYNLLKGPIAKPSTILDIPLEHAVWQVEELTEVIRQVRDHGLEGLEDPCHFKIYEPATCTWIKLTDTGGKLSLS